MKEQLHCELELENLKNRVNQLEDKLQETVSELQLSQKRYEIAMGFSDVAIFDYNIKTKKILTQPVDFELFGMPGVLENGIEEVLASGIIAQRSQEEIRELYRKIDAGAPSATATIYAHDLKGTERTLLLQMISIFDEEGSPTYAVGVRKDITDTVRFRREREYSELLTSGLTFVYEADINQDKILRYDTQWAQDAGMGDSDSLSEVLRLQCRRNIAAEDASLFLGKQAKSYILTAFQKGDRVITFEYRKRVADKGYLWFEERINLVEDEVTKDINMRAYILNIDIKKKNEMQAAAERRRYELAISKSTIVYGINVSKNSISMGMEDLKKRLTAFPSELAAEAIVPLLLKKIHPHDKSAMTALLSRKNLLQAYATGKTSLTCDFRKTDLAEEYHWYRCSIQIFEDLQTKDVLSYACVEDIHEEKEKELTLLYKAQHDLMTGVYNKHVAEEKINEILSSEEGKRGTHIFFMIDLDYFKLVNDHFGHAFGDIVLSKTSAKIAELFRNGDVLGRIGGDEFIVFMKDVKDEKIALLKGQEICDHAAQIYTRDDLDYKVTVSVGIAIFPKHGADYGQLYRHSDRALYDAKEKGRNRFSLYGEEMQSNRENAGEFDLL